MRPRAGDGLIWSGRPRVAPEWRRTSVGQVMIGLAIAAFGATITPWAWATGIEILQSPGGRRYSHLGAALVAILGAAIVAVGLLHAFWPVFGRWLRLRFRSYTLTPNFAIIHTPFSGNRIFALTPGQQIIVEEAGPEGGSGAPHGSVWFRSEAIAGEKPARRFDPVGLAPRNMRWRRVGFELIPDAPEVAAMMRAAIAALPES